ncbi:hexitol phosphatase HxpB [Sinomicrobium weinanense]|uniref:Hexitol phosphatase HxpB n=1 Tax=Sinomicrobium weinanense TaxID=2842200 RepID=A0A926JTR0_9FLAO|nr:hexitol phosphatase HxpB [Sinomicrobium weinanense]MBC9797209.1 hexitol phosphatase HxpB [Sinomicrobium weinanense]MBU3122727.1 hexitol phosphatase HxpB [Sinomicrobium weinanense]
MPEKSYAVIFDMDGVLIDSEPAWKKAEKEVFTAVGVNVLPELSETTASMTTTQVTRFWYDRQPWNGKSLLQVEHEVIDRVGHFIIREGKPIPGIREVLELFRKKGFKIGLSTNSPARLIPLVLEKTEITDYFHAVSSSEHEKEGKPHPSVYLSTAKKLGIPSANCIVFEDSVHGVMAAKNAGMKTVAIPSEADYPRKGFDLADLKLQKLADFNQEYLDLLLNGN